MTAASHQVAGDELVCAVQQAQRIRVLRFQPAPADACKDLLMKIAVHGGRMRAEALCMPHLPCCSWARMRAWQRLKRWRLGRAGRCAMSAALDSKLFARACACV